MTEKPYYYRIAAIDYQVFAALVGLPEECEIDGFEVVEHSVEFHVLLFRIRCPEDSEYAVAAGDHIPLVPCHAKTFIHEESGARFNIPFWPELGQEEPKGPER